MSTEEKRIEGLLESLLESIDRPLLDVANAIPTLLVKADGYVHGPAIEALALLNKASGLLCDAKDRYARLTSEEK